MSPPHKGPRTETGLGQVVPQLAAALLQHNPHRQGWVSPHPRARFPRQRQPRANVSTPYQRQGWVSPRPPPARVPLRQGHPPALRQQGVSKGARRAVEQWLLLFARPTVTLEHTEEASSPQQAVAIMAALVIMTAAGVGAVLEPAWQSAQLPGHTGVVTTATVHTLMIMDMLRRTPHMVTVMVVHITPRLTAARLVVVASAAN